MLPKIHIILGLIFSLIVFLIFPSVGWIGFALIFLSSFLIDIDHYLYYVWLKKDFSLKNAYNWFKKGTEIFKTLSKEKQDKVHFGNFFLHGIELIIILAILSYFWHFCLYILIGVGFHMILDLIDLKQKGVDFFKLSFLYSIYSQRNKKDIYEVIKNG